MTVKIYLSSLQGFFVTVGFVMTFCRLSWLRVVDCFSPHLFLWHGAIL